MTRQAVLIVALIVIGLVALFDGGAMTGGGAGGAMMETTWMGGFGWMWMPVLLSVGVLLVWGIFDGKKRAVMAVDAPVPLYHRRLAASRIHCASSIMR